MTSATVARTDLGIALTVVAADAEQAKMFREKMEKSKLIIGIVKDNNPLVVIGIINKLAGGRTRPLRLDPHSIQKDPEEVFKALGK